jgi:class 3 adenylate cyclase/DNA-binding response OmpR family regulator
MQNEIVLIVDDGKDNREFLVEYVLKPNGFDTLQASDGVEGLQMAFKHKPDLILLDYQMPRLSGKQVLEKLREHNMDVPVILMTLHGSEEVAVEVYRLGVKDYVKKPYYPEEMLAAIDKALTETRLRREKEALTERVLQANRELQRRLSELNTLYKVGKSVTSLANMGELLPRIVDAAIQLTNAEEASLCLVEQKSLVKRAFRNQLMKHAKAVEESIKDSVAVQVLKNSQSIILSDENIPQTTGNRPISVVYVPLIVHEKVLGTLSVANYTTNANRFSANDSALLSALSDYASIAIENSRNYTAVVLSKDKLRATFEQFVPPTVVEQATTQEEIKLGGQRQEVSILFADIRGYTTWSETLAPEVVLDTLNHYLNLASGVIMGWEGTLDKYLGDGLMAIFNAPLSQNDHVHRVADAAIAVMRAAEEVNAQHGLQLQYSIGVTVGEAVVGYIGSERALNYTAIGDTVNLAKRLQEVASPGQILIDESVVARLNGQIVAKALGEIKVKGRKTPVTVYELQDVR